MSRNVPNIWGNTLKHEPTTVAAQRDDLSPFCGPGLQIIEAIPQVHLAVSAGPSALQAKLLQVWTLGLGS
jgi:hypothetical protein